jgi:hypothetical protein
MCWPRFVKKMSKVASSVASLFQPDATLVSQETWISPSLLTQTNTLKL